MVGGKILRKQAGEGIKEVHGWVDAGRGCTVGGVFPGDKSFVRPGNGLKAVGVSGSAGNHLRIMLHAMRQRFCSWLGASSGAAGRNLVWVLGGRLVAMLAVAALVWPWHRAGGEAVAASAMQVRDGFSVERLCTQHSWVAMCFDDRGHLYAAEQGPKIYRVSPPAPGVAFDGEVAVEVISEVWGDGQTQGMAFINGYLYLVRHGNHAKDGFRPDTIVRLKRLEGDGGFGEPEKIFEFPAVPGENVGWESDHGVHGIVPGPDGRSIYVVAGETIRLPAVKCRTPPHWNRDRWGETFQREPYAGGWVMRADLDGRNAEVLCMGLRNSYDIAFNARGDLFTYDSDLEFTIGLPDYRPTAVRQILSGTDSGWAGRAGDMQWNWTPKWEDIQPPVKNVGPGSPTGVCFGYGAKFPAQYQQAFFMCDWSYGRLLAAHLSADGATYTGEVETFLSASGLPIADLAVSPADGALYFVTGGRQTQGGLYRIVYTGREATTAVAPVDEGVSEVVSLRQKLESFHGVVDPGALDFLWPHLGHGDRAVRGAARVALEWQPVGEWKSRALQETRPRIALLAMLALARSTDGQVGVQAELLEALEKIDFGALGADEQAWHLRIITVSAIRHGLYVPEVAARLVAGYEAHWPTRDRRVNEEIVAMSAALGSTSFSAVAIGLLEASLTQEEQVHYTRSLLSPLAVAALTPELRNRFFKAAVQQVPRWIGGSSVKPLRESVLRSLTEMLTEDERRQHADLIAAAGEPASAGPVVARSFVKAWKTGDFTPAMEAALKGDRDLANGRRLYAATGCLACHNFRGEGGLAGPDLSSAGGRYSARDLLENILEPSKVINEQYSLKVFTQKDGSEIVGRLVNMSANELILATNPMDPGGSEVRLRPDDVTRIAASPVSLMPPGLVNTLNESELLDLLAYLTQPVVPLSR